MKRHMSGVKVTQVGRERNGVVPKMQKSDMAGAVEKDSRIDRL